MSIESMIPSNHLILCCPLLLLPSIFPNIKVFSNESVLHIRWPEFWSFSFNISPSNEHPGLVSFRTDWLDLLAVQGTLKSLLQHHSSKASILWHSAFFIVQVSHPYMTTGKTIALTRWTTVGKVISLLLNMLSRLVIAFLPRSKQLLISWLQSPSAVILESKNKVCHCFHCFPTYLPWSDGTKCHDLCFLNVEFFFPFIFISWRLITLEYCSGFCHTLTWISHGFTCFPCPDPLFRLPHFKPTFSLSSFTFIKRLFSFSSLSAIRVVSSVCLRWN